MKRWAIIYLLHLSIMTHAQSVSTLVGARAAGMGYTSSVLVDETALFNNVGALAENKKPASFFTYEARPALPGADRTSMGISLPTKFGVGAIGFFRFGDDLYSEQIASAGFGNKFGITSLGVKVNYIQYRAEGFGTKNAVSINFGGLAQITPQISVGAYIVNLNQSRISPDENLPTKLVTGIGFKPVDNFFIATELEKDLDYHVTWRTGAEYIIHKKVFARTGFNLNPSSTHFGLGTKTSRLKIDYAITFSALGTAHQASAIYQFQRNRK